MAIEARVWPDVAIPPGEFLTETLEALGLTQAELARRAGRPPQAINEIVKGTKEITPDTAIQFERVTGVPAHIWNRLDADYRYVKARLADQERLKSEIPLAERYPYNEMASHGWVPRAREPMERVQALLAFFAVNSLRNGPMTAAAAFRRSEKVVVSTEALAVWLRQGEREAQQIATGAFKAENLRAALPQLRSLTRLSAEEFKPTLMSLLAQRGVALVVVPHLPKTGAHGATRWLSHDKALLQMSLRYKWRDIFWFSLFHELGHLLLHGRNDVFIEDNRHDIQEEEANGFAMETLIPRKDYEAFVVRKDYTSTAVRRFADQQGIAPSIIVERLQHDHHISYSLLNGLRGQFVWRRE